MIRIVAVGILLVMAAAGRAGDEPKKSADVVQVKLIQGSIADGLETYHLTLTVNDGWRVYANPPGAKVVADSAMVVEFLIDGKVVTTHEVAYPKGVTRKNADGADDWMYEGIVSFTGWLIYDDSKNAKVTAKVKVVATDGKTRLKESVVTAEVK